MNKACEGGGGFVGSTAAGTNLTLEKCGFSGVVTGNNTDNGGLLGFAGGNSTLNFKHSYNTGNIYGAGLFGNTDMKINLNAHNCYNAGSYETNPLMGAKAGQGNVNVNGENLGCIAANNDISVCNANFKSYSEGVSACSCWI